ncbi:clock-associated PAS protein ZTL [Klebsormidium nitens]|uniref:Clock-associated PAS protein ZTL n=1 Tax=Klebsormidium nitens TaxID=105231 RepID=A0A1Y1HU11_KLENI|nr:clock-associated PAS protein ZTL [Klebsormidium nitens]|eukprot:GAQ80669.1 clock-associated PAS protein ZTL [Klebsormidium nitens]
MSYPGRDAYEEMDDDGVPLFLRGDDEKTRRRIEVLLHSSPHGLIVTDALAEDHPITYVNTIFQYYTGYDAESILGRNCRFLQMRGEFADKRHPAVDLKTVRKMREAIAAGQEFKGELLNFKKDGTPLINNLLMTPIHGEDGIVTHFIGIQSFRPIKMDLGPLPERPWKDVPPVRHSELPPVQPSEESFAAGTFGGASRHNPAVFEALSDEVLVSRILGRLAPKDVAICSMVCRRFRRLGQDDYIWKRVCRNSWGHNTAAAIQAALDSQTPSLGWARIARELTTLEAAAWRKFTVGGSVEPSRCNFSECAVGNKLVLFGGEGVNMQPMNDTFVLDLSLEHPAWRHVDVSAAPPGRWGHTLCCLNGSWLVVFGGCGTDGPLNDVFVLDLDAEHPAWREVAGAGPPLPRSWHSSCTVDGTYLVVFGGCTDTGRLLSDTFLLDLTAQKPVWREIVGGFKPPSRLGHSLSVLEGSKVLMFGGLAQSGPLRLRSSDVFTIDVGIQEPNWNYLTGSMLPGGAPATGPSPPPRLDHVAATLPGGRVLIFGGSVAGQHSPIQLYVLDPKEGRPSWRMLNAPGLLPQYAWGHSTCVVGGGTRAVVLGGFEGEERLLNELHELSLLDVEGGDGALGTSELEGRPEGAKQPDGSESDDKESGESSMMEERSALEN